MNWQRATIFFTNGETLPHVLVSFDNGGWVHVREDRDIVTYPGHVIDRVEWFPGSGATV